MRSVRPARRRAALLLAAVLAAGPLLLGGQVAAAVGPGPSAVDDAVSSPVGSRARLAGATNDRPGAAVLSPRLTVFPTDQLSSLPGGSSISADGRTLAVNHHGTFTIYPGDGSISFTPWTSITGPVSARYRITDAAGATDDGLLSVEVTAGGAYDGAEVYRGNRLSGVDVLANDTPGRNADGTAGTLDRGSVRFADSQRDPGVTVSDDHHTLRESGLGVLTLDDAGVLTFYAYSADRDYTSDGEVTYTAQDTTRSAGGTTEHHSYLATIDLRAYPSTVFPKDDRLATPFNASITLPGTVNDHDSDPARVFRPGLSRFWRGSVDPGDVLSTDQRTLRRTGHGTWTINADGTVSFVPVRSFVGTDRVVMFVFDDFDHRGDENLAVTVEPGPEAVADTATTAQDVTTSVAVLANDTPGRNADGTAGSMDATYVRFPADGQPVGAVVSAYARTLTVPEEGVYTADRVTGTVTFDPAPRFVGPASPVSYSAQDAVVRTDGRIVRNPVTSTLTVRVAR